MQNRQYVDIHTHALTHDPRIIEVQSLDPRTPVEISAASAERFCFGLHPWYVDEVEQDFFFSALKTALQCPGFFALGEIGLDRSRAQNLDKQIILFQKQLEYAQKFRIERIVIHCVRAYFDMLPELKKLTYRPTIIFHDFNGNMDTAEKLMDGLNSYFSFGTKIFDENTKAAKTFMEIPLERTFLETDDQVEKSIFALYDQAAKLRNTELEAIQGQFKENFLSIAPLD